VIIIKYEWCEFPTLYFFFLDKHFSIKTKRIRNKINFIKAIVSYFLKEKRKKKRLMKEIEWCDEKIVVHTYHKAKAEIYI